MLSFIPNSLRDVSFFSMVLRLVLSMLLGGAIGMERGRKRRPAGVRTHMLVAVGSTLVMVTNQYIHQIYGASDPVRMGAQVISGIGFLGAGTIILTGHNFVIGLTTAAGLWSSACIGLAVGTGFYEGGIVGGILIVLILIVFQNTDNTIISKSRLMEIYVELEKAENLSVFLNYMSSNGIKITFIELIKAKEDNSEGLAALVTLRLPKRESHHEILTHLKNAPGIKYIEEV